MSRGIRPQPPRVVAIPGEGLDASRVRAWAHEAVLAQLPAIQLRCKHLSDIERWRIGHSLDSIAASSGKRRTVCMTNGRADLALSLGWGAVHLPSQGLRVGHIRSILGDGALVGRSTHSLAEVEAAAAEGADYVFFGPIFDTPSKRPFGAPLGVGRLREAASAVSIPVLAIGGVTTVRFAEIAAAGAYGIAAIGLFAAPSHAASILDAFDVAFEG